MDKLTIARMVATNPRMVALVQRRTALYNRMRADYGREFMGLAYVDMPTDAEERTALETEEMERGNEGVNRWTRPERAAYFSLERRIVGMREALTKHYAQTA